MSYRADTLDCQRCGDVLRNLTPAEAQKVAKDPHKFIVYCTPCRREVIREQKDLML